MAEVSVVIPVHNRLSLLRRSIASVQRQTFAPLEIIVVDDHSDDDVRGLVEAMSSDALPVRWIPLTSGRGANAGRNRGVAAAKGELVAFQDSDDVWLPDKLDRQVSAWDKAGRPAQALVYCYVDRVLADGTTYRVGCPADAALLPAAALLRGNFISTQAVLAPRRLLVDNAFDESLPRLQDWELWLRMAATAVFLSVPETGVVAYETSDSITSDPSRYADALAAVVDRHKALLATDTAAYAHHCCVAARALARQRMFGRAARFAIRGIRADLCADRRLLSLRLPRADVNVPQPVGSRQ